MNVSPHPGPTGFGILGTNPNGTIVIHWARELLQMSIEELEAGLARAGAGPASVATDAALTPLPHVAGGDARGATFSGGNPAPPPPAGGARFAGVTPATSRLDVVRALLEAIACELALTLQRLGACGVDTSLIRAT